MQSVPWDNSALPCTRKTYTYRACVVDAYLLTCLRPRYCAIDSETYRSLPSLDITSKNPSKACGKYRFIFIFKMIKTCGEHARSYTRCMRIELAMHSNTKDSLLGSCLENSLAKSKLGSHLFHYLHCLHCHHFLLEYLYGYKEDAPDPKHVERG